MRVCADVCFSVFHWRLLERWLSLPKSILHGRDNWIVVRVEADVPMGLWLFDSVLKFFVHENVINLFESAFFDLLCFICGIVSPRNLVIVVARKPCVCDGHSRSSAHVQGTTTGFPKLVGFLQTRLHLRMGGVL